MTDTTIVQEPTTLAKAMAAIGGGSAPTLISDATVIQLYDALASVEKMSEVPGFAKATFNQSGSATSGLTAYDLEGPAKLFYPVLTPLRNMIPRVSGKGGIQASWRAITGVNTGRISAGVSEGNRGGIIAVTTADYIAAYRGIGFESNATFEAQYAGEGFDDIRKRAAQSGLHSLMLAEEKIILAGNGTLQLGTTPTPSLTASTTGGTLATATYSVIAVGLTAYGYVRSTVAGGLTQSVSRTNADATTDTINGGVAQKSAAASVAVTGATGRIIATVAAQRGAQAYAWYWGAAGSETLGAITTVPALSITATATGTQLASALTAADFSTVGLEFDGIITQALKSGSGAYWTDLGGATLTANGTGGIVEIDAVLKAAWDTYRINPEIMWVSSQQVANITSKILSGGSTSNLRFNVDMKQGMVIGGTLATEYLNPYGMGGVTTVRIIPHPDMVPGTILFTQMTLPYPLADTANLIQIKTRQDYYQIEWPLRSRKYEYGIYADEVLQIYAPFTLSVLTGIGVG